MKHVKFTLSGMAVVLALGAGGLVQVSAHAQPKTAAPAAKAATPITAAAVHARNWPTELRLSGVVQPWHEAVVNARSNGLPLVAVNAEVGDVVKKGQVLASFDDRQPRAELAQAQATLTQLQASLEQAQTNAQRMGALRGTGAVSEEAVLQAMTQARTTAAQVQGAQAALDSAKLRLEHCVVRAPDSGTITQRNAALGQTFATGGEMFRLMRQSRLEWRAEVSMADVARIKAGQAVVVELADGSQASAKVRQIAPGLNASNRQAVVQVELPQHPLLKPQALLQGRLRLGEASVLVVPAQAVVLRDGRAHVFVLHQQADKTVAKALRVDTGRSESGFIELRAELPLGQRVAVRGAGFLADGEAVSVQADTAQGDKP